MQQMAQPKSPHLDEYRPSDLGIAAFVSALDVPLLRVENGGPRVSFVFPRAAEWVAARFYRPGENLVDVRRFHFCLREMRGLTRQHGERR